MALLKPEFSVIVPGVLLVGSHPERSGPLQAVLRALRDEGVGGIVSLVEQPLDPEALRQEGLDGLHLPVENYAAPAPEQLQEGVAFIERLRSKGQLALAHCFAGVGRAGTMGAAYLMSQGQSAEDAIAEMRRLRHRSCVETTSQYEALVEFEGWLKAGPGRP